MLSVRVLPQGSNAGIALLKFMLHAGGKALLAKVGKLHGHPDTRRVAPYFLIVYRILLEGNLIADGREDRLGAHRVRLGPRLEPHQRRRFQPL